mgnify:CR=1 FL=1
MCSWSCCTGGEVTTVCFWREVYAFCCWESWRRWSPGCRGSSGPWLGRIITTVELAAGLIFNRDYAVWDYRGIPGNFCGQICP